MVIGGKNSACKKAPFAGVVQEAPLSLANVTHKAEDHIAFVFVIGQQVHFLPCPWAPLFVPALDSVVDLRPMSCIMYYTPLVTVSFFHQN